MYSVQILDVFRHSLKLDRELNDVIEEALNIAKAFEGVGKAYVRFTVKVRGESLHLARLIVSPSKLREHVGRKIKLEHIGELLKELTRLNTCKPELELVITPIDEDMLNNTYLGDLYFKDLMTPLSRALTYAKVSSAVEHLLIDEMRFNICSVTDNRDVVGCLITSHTSEALDLDRVRSVANAISTKIGELGLTHGHVTWLLSNNSIYIVDY